MGKYDDARDVVVNEKYPLLNEKESDSIVEVLSTGDGLSNKDGAPFAKVDVRILHSDVYPEGQIRTWLAKQNVGKGARTYYLQDLKSFVGACLNKENKSDVSGPELDEFFSDDCKHTGVVLNHRVYQKPPNDKGKIFNGCATQYFAADADEYKALTE